jgi:general secretion pathway protein D
VQYHDPEQHLTEEEYKRAYTPSPKPLTEFFSSSKDKRRGPKMSLHVSDHVPLRHLLLWLCQKQKVGLAYDADLGIRRGIHFQAYNKSFEELLDQLSRLYQVRIEFEGDILYVGPDVPYFKSYDIQFLTGLRQAENQLNVRTDLGGGSTSRMGNSQSSSTLTSRTQLNFWDELERNIQMILGIGAKELLLSTPKSTSIKSKPVPQEQNNSKGRKKVVSEKETRTQEKSLNSSAATSTSPRYTFHKQAGILSVFCGHIQHRLIARYLSHLKRLAGAQVTIEAKIVEVLLKEEFKTGLDWKFLGQKIQNFGHFGVPTLISGETNGLAQASQGFTTLRLQPGKLNAALSLMGHFGTVRTISNPRITVLNNQPALFKVAQNEVFFKIALDRVIANQNRPEIETVTSQMQTVPIGLVMTVQPSINLDSGEITLSIRPSISRVVERRPDPAVAIQSKNSVSSEVPVVQVREMDSVIKVLSNQVVVMGGLMEKMTTNDAYGLPNVRETWLGRLLGGKQDGQKLSELVIFLTATLSPNPICQSDKRLYQTL